MSDITENFRAFLLADSDIKNAVGPRVHEDHVPQLPDGQAAKDFVWFRKRQAQGAETLDSQAGEGPKFIWLDVECVSEVQRNTKRLSELVRARCNCYRGAFGASTVQGIFVADQDGDYLAQSIGGEDGFYVEALDVQVVL